MYTSVRYIHDKGRIPLKLQNIVKQENLHELNKYRAIIIFFSLTLHVTLQMFYYVKWRFHSLERV